MPQLSIFAVDPPRPETVNRAQRAFAIHPGIGIARMGNAPDEFFIGPETPGVDANWNEAEGKFHSFRDADPQGRIKRQGARFRVFEYFWDEPTGTWGNPKEVRLGDDVVDIEWRVHLANRKASFFVFDGQNGADDLYLARSNHPANEQIKKDPDRTNLRNADVAQADRAAQLEIDPGELTISARQLEPVEVKNPNSNIRIKSLGTLRVDDQGRLIVLGGYGQTETTDKRPEFEMEEYASNDRWFDDASDGSVKARLKLKDGTAADAEAAWVMVGPPDFAPAIGNVVSLYDTMWDVAVRNLPARKKAGLTGAALKINEQRDAWLKNNAASLSGYKPSFLEEIYPLVKRAIGARDVHVSGNMNQHYHATLLNWARLAAQEGRLGQEGKLIRKATFDYMRDPGAPVIEWEKMPRGMGDNYRDLEKFEDGDLEAGKLPAANSLFSLTRVQYAVLREWAAGNFENDWPGAEPQTVSAADPTPDQLDKAAADNSVGGPFYPGIDCSWLIRTPELYVAPFRFRIPPQPAAEVTDGPLKIGALEFRPGFFSQQMALPWQADFYDCQKERNEDQLGNEYYFMWWTAHRPDDVFPVGGVTQVRWTRLFDQRANMTPDVLDEDKKRFTLMRDGWHDLKFISVRNGNHWEEEA
jgi:hypothetical protein